MNETPMMQLTPEDKETIKVWVERYGDNGGSPSDLAPVHLDNGLYEWNSAKQNLFKLFGNRLRLSQFVSIKKTEDMMLAEFRRLTDYSECARAYQAMDRLWFRWCCHHIGIDPNGFSIYNWVQRFFDAREHFEDTYVLTNVIGGELPGPKKDSVKVTFTNGKTYIVHRGASFCRVVHQMLKLGSNEYDDIKENNKTFEEFRIWQSQLRNQNKLEGNLVLSIHPLDYITMSDNDCDWTSCMCWRDGPGDYRAGTVEMMNSENVVIGYLEAKEPFIFRGHEIPNKKWRTLLIAEPETIINVKGYPYQNDTLASMLCYWLAKLAKQNWGVDFTQKDTIENMSNEDERRFRASLMYNDFVDNKVHRFWYYNDKPKRIVYSGIWRCMCCGSEEIDLNFDPSDSDINGVTSWVVCADCGSVRDLPRCYYCGKLLSEENICEMGGQLYCTECAKEIGVWDPCDCIYLLPEKSVKIIAVQLGTQRALYCENIEAVIHDHLSLYLGDKADTFLKKDDMTYLINYDDLSPLGRSMFDDWGEIE